MNSTVAAHTSVKPPSPSGRRREPHGRRPQTPLRPPVGDMNSTVAAHPSVSLPELGVDWEGQRVGMVVCFSRQGERWGRAKGDAASSSSFMLSASFDQLLRRRLLAFKRWSCTWEGRLSQERGRVLLICSHPHIIAESYHAMAQSCGEGVV